LYLFDYGTFLLGFFPKLYFNSYISLVGERFELFGVLRKYLFGGRGISNMYNSMEAGVVHACGAANGMCQKLSQEK
jgi:hypothetical protein